MRLLRPFLDELRLRDLRRKKTPSQPHLALNLKTSPYPLLSFFLFFHIFSFSFAITFL